MTRLARVVSPVIPRHVTQRGNGRTRTFFGEQDHVLHRDLLATNCRAAARRGVGFLQFDALSP